jgi:hypothetical protein
VNKVEQQTLAEREQARIVHVHGGDREAYRRHVERTHYLREHLRSAAGQRPPLAGLECGKDRSVDLQFDQKAGRATSKLLKLVEMTLVVMLGLF